ncbi:glycerol-3-phosphate phosphatase (GppA) [Aspergillus nomiae NRRL 13137]|uniref:Glycerol-3-phosphate phosphatase (GppA) n=1 Tax=Aspergillus nomiae NRRL (strain ATCC 15546 / NRRL 13137 / CBS 260.88 / M93) TaxID=1509407 RepID=A0A0L1JGL7_ASPN3|nr:glycerol-3-phosphate phosphatase (GppA) [Aspergillus nomiae NRRL 13137]KNG90513.1 glycerol-3-phosphate phosphatase (GppA) [Aspergillus nomiae NRRL 13137]
MPSAAATESFSAATKEYAFDAVLLDFDGTILDTTPAVVKFWHSIASELGIDPETVLATSHGRRTLDTLALYDTSKANWDYVSSIEARIPREFSTNSDVSEVPGSRELLTALQKAGARWGIVTSGTRALISGWVDRLGLVRPSMLIAAEDVHVGKPDPQGYLLGRKQLGLRGDESSVLVIEDAPAGIRAGKAAGFKVLAVKTSHSVEQLRAAGPDWIVEDLRSVSVRGVESGLVKVEITAAFM